jgi:NADPH2:quinone reductase
MRAWVLREHGDPLQVLELADIDSPSPKVGELLMSIEAAGLAFPDLLRIRGEYQITQQPGTVPGVEFVGRVSECGPETSLPVGTRVMGVSQIGDGTLADLAVAREVDVCPIPEDMPTQHAATLPANYSTAYYALHVRAKVSAGEIVVVNGGAGGVGSAAIQLARAAGARVLADDLGESRAQLCLDFGAHVAVDVAEEDLTAAIREFSDGKGADIVVDSVGGEAFVACRRAMASEGRLVVVGFTSGTIPQLKVNQLIFGNYTVMGVNAFFYTSAFRGVMEHLLELYTSGLITPPIDAQFPFAQAPEVFARIEARQIKGRAVVLVDTSAVVPPPRTS